MIGVNQPIHKLTLVASDLLLLALAFYASTMIRLGTPPKLLSVEFIGITAILGFCLFVSGAYSSDNISLRPKLPFKTLFVVLSGGALSLLFVYSLGPEKYTAMLGRGVFPFAVISFGVAAMLSRLVINQVFRKNGYRKNIVFLGGKSSFLRLAEALKGSNSTLNLKHVTDLQKLSQLKQKPNAIVISPKFNPDEDGQRQLLRLRLSGIIIYSLADFYEGFLFLVPINEVDNDWFIRAEGFTMLHSFASNKVKRCVDILVASILLVLTTPLLLLVAATIKLTSHGPLLFSQTRVGFEGKNFILYKFRTMTVSAEQDGAQWAVPDDPRILPVGGFLRRTRIDELPQCWNILKGDMSIIGPRPERPEFTTNLANKIPYYNLRHVIKPGLTGWAQVCYPYGASVEDALRKLQYDLYYIKNHSVIFDLNILMRTILVTLRRSGR